MTGKQLSDEMSAAGLTVAELASRLGVSHDTVQGWRSRPGAAQCCSYMARQVARILARARAARERNDALRGSK